MKIRIKRAYDKPEKDDGYRVLVDRLWPRGIKKEDLKIDDWYKDVAPSNELRKWFGHDSAKFGEFKDRYFAELTGSNAASKLLVSMDLASQLTLVYSAKDTEHNQAVVLKEYLEQAL